MPRRVLFLCTGNYYRSRFAEILFDHLAAAAGLPWKATSRALAIERGIFNVGPISPHTREALKRLAIPLPDPLRPPIPAIDDDFRNADLIIALKEAEHRPVVESRHAAFAHRVKYWHVHDTDMASPLVALAEVEQLVTSLVAELLAARAAKRPLVTET